MTLQKTIKITWIKCSRAKKLYIKSLVSKHNTEQVLSTLSDVNIMYFKSNV